MSNTFPLTIITVTYNACADLKVTFDNVRSLKKKIDFEYIVIDGLSTDNTLELIRLNRDIIDLFVHEKDSGIYNAMNKALPILRGNWFVYLNAGDKFNENNMNIAFDYLCKSDSSIDILYGGYSFNYDERIIEVRPKKNLSCKDFLLSNPICHQATFYKSEHFVRNKKLFDEKYKLISDQVVLYQEFYKHSKIDCIDEILVEYDISGVSSIQRKKVLDERIKFTKNVIDSDSSYNTFYWVMRLNLLSVKHSVYEFMKRKNILDYYRRIKW